MPLVALLLTTSTLLGTAHAGSLAQFDFSGPVTQEHFKQVLGKLRCLVCQNETLLDSQAELAQDLRREVYDLMASGKSDQEVIDFLTARYGDFVLYDPPVKPSTYLLWYGPFALFVVGMVALLVTVRRRGQGPEPQLSPEEQARARRLLDEADEGDNRT
ncbi:MAG TPA: cytochrome c-type biogenesis protein CcmH [Chromatiales bacterium]|nr:cytochrome c-type biogenesis protein CcmH [Chromatiales bacterium]